MILPARYDTKLYYDISDVIKDNEVKAVILIIGPYGRAKMIEKIIDSSKDVMTTKPFDLSSSETLNVLQKAIKLKRVVHMNSPAPVMTDDLIQIKYWVDEYNLGSPISYRATTWCSYREAPNNSWYDDPRLCPVAPIFRLGIYLLNDLGYFCLFPF